ncbi:hypothetical protein [Streptomyces sp. NPDC048612]|uniref:hypothetical protein n=1 Tax=Streptomyces sp. NPDC048612 TaxID=3365579 RepID=UPI0037139B65
MVRIYYLFRDAVVELERHRTQFDRCRAEQLGILREPCQLFERPLKGAGQADPIGMQHFTDPSTTLSESTSGLDGGRRRSDRRHIEAVLKDIQPTSEVFGKAECQGGVVPLPQ